MALRGRWTKEDVEALNPYKLRALRKNAARARDDLVVSWCDEVLQGPAGLTEATNPLSREETKKT